MKMELTMDWKLTAVVFSLFIFVKAQPLTGCSYYGDSCDYYSGFDTLGGYNLSSFAYDFANAGQYLYGSYDGYPNSGCGSSFSGQN